MEVSNHLIRQNMQSWNKFMANSENWMGNFSNTPVPILTPTAIMLFKEQISHV